MLIPWRPFAAWGWFPWWVVLLGAQNRCASRCLVVMVFAVSRATTWLISYLGASSLGIRGAKSTSAMPVVYCTAEHQMKNWSNLLVMSEFLRCVFNWLMNLLSLGFYQHLPAGIIYQLGELVTKVAEAESRVIMRSRIGWQRLTEAFANIMEL